jgi:hypothetical protein
MTVFRHTAGNAHHNGEARHSPRTDSRLDAVLVSKHGEVSGTVVNLSRTGLCIESGKALADLLLAGCRQGAGKMPVLVRVQFALPAGAAGTLPVTVQARTVYVIQDRADTYRCGLEFRLFTEGGAAFEDYLHASGLVD